VVGFATKAGSPLPSTRPAGEVIMKPTCLQYRLTEAERRTFEESGYLQVEDALTAAQVSELTGLLDPLYRRQLETGAATPFNPAHLHGFLSQHPAFAELVDHERILPKVWGILGWNIYLYHAHVIVSPFCHAPYRDKTFPWHQDSARVNLDIETSPRPRLSVKVAYFLTDTSEDGRGNTWVIPGSQRRDVLELPPGGRGQPAGAIPILARPGTAVLFDRRLWHSSTPNWSRLTRKVLFCGYSYRWLRPKDDLNAQTLWPDSSPIRKQLLGYGLNANGYYSPSDEEVPLRDWLRQHSPPEAR
jgi:ectoine hydroxylase